MTTIQKRANELKPGDVITGLPPSLAGQARTPCIVLSNAGPHGLHVWDTVEEGKDELRPMPATLVEVESILTPAQQHAEELAELVRRTSRMGVDTLDQASLRDSARAVLSKIDPPEPPTLEEALALLQRYEASGDDAWMLDDTRAMLGRARRANLIK